MKKITVSFWVFVSMLCLCSCCSCQTSEENGNDTSLQIDNTVQTEESTQEEQTSTENVITGSKPSIIRFEDAFYWGGWHVMDDDAIGDIEQYKEVGVITKVVDDSNFMPTENFQTNVPGFRVGDTLYMGYMRGYGLCFFVKRWENHYCVLTMCAGYPVSAYEYGIDALP